MCFKLLYISLTYHFTGLFSLRNVHYKIKITCLMRDKVMDRVSMVEKSIIMEHSTSAPHHYECQNHFKTTGYPLQKIKMHLAQRYHMECRMKCCMRCRMKCRMKCRTKCHMKIYTSNCPQFQVTRN